MKQIIFCILFIFQFTFSCQQFIFESTEKCEYEIDNRRKFFTGDVLNTTRNRRQYFFSLCGSLPEKYGCKSGANVCIKTERGESIDGGTRFKSEEDEDGVIALTAQSSSKCPYGVSYFKTYIYFVCSSNIKPIPTIIESNDCDVKIQMIDPKCDKIKCAANINGNFINLHEFRNKPLTFKSQSRRYFLNLCGPTSNCGDGRRQGACEIEGNSTRDIGNLESQHFYYNDKDKKLLARMYAGVKKYRIKTEVYVKCNWNEPSYSNAKIIKESKREIQFQIESKAGCIKTPMNCYLKQDHVVYNFSNLYKSSNWRVKNISNIMINICGPLNVRNKCAGSYSQVCLDNNINYGSILKSLEKLEEYDVKAVFTDGDKCSTNTDESLSTTVIFKCSEREFGPYFKEKNNCSLTIEWKTPEACPNQVYYGIDCLITDFTGRRNISKIYSITDQIHIISQKSYIRYNLCGPLKKPCQGFQNVSACYVQNDQEKILGYASRNIVSNNGLLSLTLAGDFEAACQKNRTLNVNFHCDYSPPNLIQRETLRTIQDNCIYELNVFTPLACESVDNPPCKISDGFVEYDFTPLALQNKNYVIRNNRENTEYILNVCQFIVTSVDSMCEKSAVCFHNKSEPNSILRFKQLGMPDSPKIVNGKPVLHHKYGHFCLEKTDYSEAIINFECSTSKEVGPVFVESKNCVYSFLWKTKYACPKVVTRNVGKRESDCNLKDSTTGMNLNLGPILDSVITIEVKNNNMYVFDICSTKYQIKVNNNSEEKYSTLEIDKYNDMFNLSFTLDHNCTNVTPNIFRVIVKCQESSENFTYVGVNGCVFTSILQTNSTCSSTKDADSTTSKNISTGEHPIKFIDHELNDMPLKMLDTTQYDMKNGAPNVLTNQRSIATSEKPDINIAGIISGSVFGAVILVAIISFFIWRQVRKHNYKIISDKRNTPVYMKDTVM